VRTALDTNILSALWSREPHAAALSDRLGRFKLEGALLISPIVYAELLSHPNASESFLNDFLANTGIRVDYQLDEAVWTEAGRRFARYAHRRRQATQEGPRRLLADFIIGVHALLHADRLMTFDPIRFQQDFPDLRLESDTTP
jgi:predicted nucleic acid-binding protein